MLKNHCDRSVGRLAALALILIIGLNIVYSQSPPAIFKIENITAFPDKGVYLRNEIIQIEYKLNCSGKTGEKSFIFKANRSFEINETPRYEPRVVYPPEIGHKSEKPYFYSTPDGFRRYYVPLFDNNNGSRRYLIEIMLNISPTLECRLNRTYNLADRSFVDIRPAGRRISSSIEIVNRNPDVIGPIISEKEKLAQFTINDEDSRFVEWALFKNGRRIPGYSGNISMKEDPLDNNTINISLYLSELAYLKLHLIDSDGGDYWSSPLSNWPEKEPRADPEEAIRRDYLIFAFVAIILSVIFFNYHSLGLHSRLGLYAIVTIIIQYVIFRLDFIFLLLLLIVLSSVSNYSLHLLSSIKENEAEQRKFITKWTLVCSLWFLLIISITVNRSSIENVERELNHLAIMGVCITFLSILLAIFATDKLSNLKQYAKKFEIAAGVYCVLWIVFYSISIHDTYIKTLSDAHPENFLVMLYLTFFSLILLPALIYFYFAPELKTEMT
ncbi:MAG: hypothetical protein PHQ34_02485 [Methanothrix sp.]|nr:hypothetical protein [Methanothrix sp.]